MAQSLLIVDDNSLIRKVIRSCFEKDPRFQICGEAADGLDAIEKAVELRPDLVILDIAMPRMNGVDAARVLRSMMPSLPIIVFTWYASILQPSDVQTAGISAVVSKSDLSGLVKHVEGVLPAA